MHENKSLKELRELAKSKGLKGYSTMNKPDLIIYITTGNRPISSTVPASKRIVNVEKAVKMASRGFKWIGIEKGLGECDECGKYPIVNLCKIYSRGEEYTLGTTCVWKPFAIGYLDLLDPITKQPRVKITKNIIDSSKYVWLMERDRLLEDIIDDKFIKNTNYWYSKTLKYPTVMNISDERLKEITKSMYIRGLKRRSIKHVDGVLSKNNLKTDGITDKSYKKLVDIYTKGIKNGYQDRWTPEVLSKLTDKQKNDLKDIENQIKRVGKYASLSPEERLKMFKKWLNENKLEKEYINILNRIDLERLKTSFIFHLNNAYNKKYDVIHDYYKMQEYLKKFNLIIKFNGFNDRDKKFIMGTMYRKYKYNDMNNLTLKQKKYWDYIVKGNIRTITGSSIATKQLTLEEKGFIGKQIKEWKIRDMKEDIVGSRQIPFYLHSIVKSTEKAILGKIVDKNGNFGLKSNGTPAQIWIPKRSGFEK